MKKEEIQKIIEIMCLADNGCKYCVFELVEEFTKEFNLDKEGIREMVKKVGIKKNKYWKDEMEDLFNEECGKL